MSRVWIEPMPPNLKSTPLLPPVAAIDVTGDATISNRLIRANIRLQRDPINSPEACAARAARGRWQGAVS